MIRSRLKAVSADKGILQKDLSEMTGIRQPTLSAFYCNSIKRIPVEDLDLLCKALKCQPGDILVYEEDKED